MKEKHWIAAWRKKYEMDRKLLGRLIGCGAAVIRILEEGGITHPDFANRLAELCGATVEQRDALVHEKHRGKWRPSPKKTERMRQIIEKKLVRRAQARRGGRPVVKIDRSGMVLASYVDAADAAASNGHQYMFITTRCKRATGTKTDEFDAYGHSFRYADEWAAMSITARLADIADQRARGRRMEGRTPGDSVPRSRRPVVKIDRDGRELERYPSLQDAAAATGSAASAIRSRCAHTFKGDEYAALGYSFRFAEEMER